MEMNRKNMQWIALLIAFGIFLLVGLQHLDIILSLLSHVMTLLTPFFIGVCIAFILNVPMAFIERSLFSKRKSKFLRKMARLFSMVLSLLLVIGIVAVICVLIAPQIGRSAVMLSANIPAFFRQVQQSVMDWQVQFPFLADQLQFSWDKVDWNALSQTVLRFLQTGVQDMLGSTFNVASSIVGALFNFFIGIIFALYVLSQKEKLGRQCKKLLYAFLPARIVDSLLSVCSLAQHTFTSFITGQCTEAVILGMMFFISMSILRLPYALLISVLIGTTALIPVFGAMIGCVIGAFFILVQSPVQALWFIILFLILQQIEGNIIYPHVVGGSIGLPSIWVLVAVIVGGNTWGIVGMIVCIPLASVLYALLRSAVNLQLRTRRVPREKWDGTVPPSPPPDHPGQDAG